MGILKEREESFHSVGRLSGMANRKVSFGAIVFCPAEKIVGKKRAENLLGKGNASTDLQGVVMGPGQGLKWKVQWSLPDGTLHDSEHGARVLSLSNSAETTTNRDPQNLEQQNPEAESSSSDESDGTDSGESDSEMDTDSDHEWTGSSHPDLRVNDLQWIEEPDGIVDDWRAQAGYTSREGPRLLWHNLGLEYSGLGTRCRRDYWRLFMPDLLDLVVKETNSRLEKMNKKLLSKGELEQVIGIIYALGVGGKRTRRDNWETETESIFPSAKFGERFGVGYHRFEDIINNMQWYETGSEYDDENDRWRPVRCFFDKFNEKVAKVYVPGTVLCVDESTIRWYGLEEWHPNGCPHVTKIARKPENKSVEVRSVGCGGWDVCIWVEPQEGAAAMAKKKFVSENLNSGTAFVLRAVEAWFGLGKIVVGDSAFGSVQTAVELRKRGTFLIGMVKTARKMFPKKYLQEVFMASRGDTLAVSAVKSGVELMAISWNEPAKLGKQRKNLVSTCSTTFAADPIERIRYKKNEETGEMEAYLRRIPVCTAAKLYFEHAGAIDRFNRVRQDGVRIERNLEFRTWDKRVITSLLGFVAANAYQAYKGEGGLEGISEFMEGLALELLTSPLLDSGSVVSANTRNVAQRESQHFSDPSALVAGKVLVNVDNLPLRHVVRPLTVLKKYANKPGAKLVCKICGSAHARYFCVSCSNAEQGAIVALCGLKADGDCVSWHCQLY